MQLNSALKFLFKNFLILFAMYLGFGMLTALLEQFIPAMDTSDYRQEFLFEMLDKSPLRAFMAIVLFAPIVEEIMFRSLIKPSHLELIMFLSVWPMFFVYRFVPFDVHWAVAFLFIGVFLFAAVYILNQLVPEERTTGIRGWLSRHVDLFWVLTTLIFGFVHVNNYVEEFTLNLALFLLIFPRILAGGMMGWIKIEKGNLVWTMAFHAINNGFALMLILMGRS